MLRQHRLPSGRVLRLLLLTGIVAAVGWKTLGGRGAFDAAASAPAPAESRERPAPAVAAEPPRAAPVAAAAPPPLAIFAPEPEPEPFRLRRPITDLDPETRAVLQARLDRERAAEERFERGLEASQVRARDIDARVRDAFQRVDLSPDLLDGGHMRGLRIQAVEGGSALAEAGFRSGDLLVRLDDRALDDPAELPDILASAGPRLLLCAQRGATEFCRELSLR